MGVNLVATKGARGLIAVLAVVVGLLALPGSASAQVPCDVDQIVQEAQDGSVAAHPLACLNQAEKRLSGYADYSPELTQRVEWAKAWTSTVSGTSTKPRQLNSLGAAAPVVSHSPLASLFDRLAPANIGEIPVVVLVLAFASGLLFFGGLLSAVSRSRSRRRMHAA